MWLRKLTLLIFLSAAFCGAQNINGIPNQVMNGFTTGTFSGLVTTGNICRITSPISLVSASAVTVCSWSIPASSTFGWQCSIPYAITAGTLPTLTLGVNASQTPVGITGYANIGSSNNGSSLQGTVSSTASGNVNILTGGSVINSTFQATTFGVIQGSATAGTFSITATLGGTVSPAGTIPVGAICALW